LNEIVGFAATVISSFVLVERNGIPEAAASAGYFLFGLLFVVLGVFTGKMLDATVWELLLLRKWNINLSLMVIGYSAVIVSLLGWGKAVLKGCSPDPD
jgi:drug/metabolite transporter (DMT)-like permease